MRENTYLKRIRKDTLKIKRELIGTQNLMLKFVQIQNKKIAEYEELFKIILKGIKNNKAVEDKKIETILNILFAITDRQVKEQQQKNILH